MDDNTTQIPTLADTGDVVEAWNDAIFYTDQSGVVVESNDVRLNYLPRTSLKNAFFWNVLALETRSLKETLKRFPPFNIHEISCCDGRSFLMRIIPLPETVAQEGGYVVIATDNQPMEALYESYEERLEDNITAWSDSITLFNAFFDMALDATFLIDDAGTIIAANTAAQKQHSRPEQGLSGEDFRRLLGKRFHAAILNAMHTIQAGKIWTETIVAIDGDGEGFPVEATLRKISFTDYSLFQLILHDLSEHLELQEDLQDQKAEVKEKEIALRQVIKSVEEERKEIREQLTSQVKKQMLPALERITTSDTPAVREGYKTVIEDQLVDLASESSGEFDSELLRLSPREMEVCQLIQLGRSGKEIAELLNMSFETVQTHRKNIRKKLGLRGRKASLFTYLRQKPSLV
ncbi:PAS and helix-turn-helix domain-containing protein [Pseudodesulfovibrio sp. zrk46]|uniref:PAS and helix-turn-helix domain-containing protein n=1 Tax=Pseudodesulfovibrio sp. zrk46 TaxID=2725288 RepID=UPI001449AB45|nr:PAS and helix-turn-helix domain-containing protein [Pseudodesulfovibrio sp. zrk46]QJB56644.1 PAS and helix-turn-helix domain-containing protein [Pseudodesulfovibrio sp. zrk46]